MKTPKVIRDFENAVRWHEMVGAQPPEERPAIEAEFQRTKAALIAMFERGRNVTMTNSSVSYLRDTKRGVPTKVFRVTWGKYAGNVEFMRDGVQNVPSVFYSRHSRLGECLTKNNDGIRTFIANQLRAQLDDMEKQRVIFIGV